MDLIGTPSKTRSNIILKVKVFGGASTISQQTAKNLFLPPARTWIRKGVEAYLTVFA